MIMKILNMNANQWKEIKEIYMEAFPKAERKLFFTIRHSVKKGKMQILTAMEENVLLGFGMIIPFQNLVMVDYLAVSGKTRSRGTGSRILQEVCHQFAGKKIMLLIERLDEHAENKEQRIARRKFYLKNGFTSSGIFITGHSGEMEILKYGEEISEKEYMELQEYALGRWMFRLSKNKILS